MVSPNGCAAATGRTGDECRPPQPSVQFHAERRQLHGIHMVFHIQLQLLSTLDRKDLCMNVVYKMYVMRFHQVTGGSSTANDTITTRLEPEPT